MNSFVKERGATPNANVPRKHAHETKKKQTVQATTGGVRGRGEKGKFPREPGEEPAPAYRGRMDSDSSNHLQKEKRKRQVEITIGIGVMFGSRGARVTQKRVRGRLQRESPRTKKRRQRVSGRLQGRPCRLDNSFSRETHAEAGRRTLAGKKKKLK